MVPRRFAIAVTALLLACGSKEAEDTGAPADDSDNAPPGQSKGCVISGEPSLQIGEGVLADFSPYGDDQAVQLLELGGTWGVPFSVLASGLDATTSPTFFIQMSFDPPYEVDFGATLPLQCDAAETQAWWGGFAPVDDVYQADPAPLDGLTLPWTATMTDRLGTTVSAAGQIILAL